MTVPCGQCIGCRLGRSRDWALRCMHEASLHENNCFITLTYNNENLPADGSLHKSHWQKFMKRLRKYSGAKIRYYHCGEYGAKLLRPHYHACLFGFDFPDKYLWEQRPGKDDLYRSDLLEKCWPFGYSSIGELTFNSAAYVARYILKKVNGDKADDHYIHIDDQGVVHKLQPEYTTMSRNKGIGQGWIEKYADDCYPHDFVAFRDRGRRIRKMKPPRYYDLHYEVVNPDQWNEVKRARKRASKLLASHYAERAADGERIQTKLQSTISRSYENEI